MIESMMGSMPLRGMKSFGSISKESFNILLEELENAVK